MLKNCKGSAVTSVIIAAFIIVFLILPVFSFIVEKIIINNKAQIIKDSLDITNIATYNNLDVSSLADNVVLLDDAGITQVFSNLLAYNLKLNPDLSPASGSAADGKVIINSLNIYISGFPISCPSGITLTRPSIHSVITIPVKPMLYRQVILSILGKQYIDLIIHMDSNIPVDQ